MTSHDPASRGEATEASLIAAGARALGLASRALVPRSCADADDRSARRVRLLLLAASILGGLAVGYAGVRAGITAAVDADAGLSTLAQALPWKAEVASDAGERREIGQLLGDVRALRAQVESLRHKHENSRLAERIRALEAGRDAAAALATRLDRMEERLAKMERIDPTPTGALQKPERGAPKPEAKAAEQSRRKSPTDDFVLREVAHGTALIERGDGLIEEVAPGDSLPGAGRVTAIERRGPGWVVVTTRGVIDQRSF